jgi:hypothetical protein
VFTAADFAECPPIAGEGAATLAGKLDAALGSSAGAYTVVLEGTETDLGSFTPKTLNVTEGRDIRITVRGNGNTVTLSSSSEGSLFTLGAGSGSSLGLELHDLTLVGRTNNNASMVQVISGGSLEMKAGSRITGNSSYSAYGGGVYVYSSGTFTKQPGAVIYGSNESVSALRNTTGANGHAVYVGGSPPKTRYTAAGTGITLDSSLGGSAGDWEEPLPSTSSDGISGITYSSVSGGEWTVQSDGRRKSPSIAHSGATKTRVSFTSAAANANITIALDVSSESGYDFAFISTLDNGSATYSSGYYTGSRISGTVSVTVSIPVPAAGSLNGK